MPHKCITCKLKRASFNRKNERQRLYCSSCKLENTMLSDIKGVPTCNIKQANCNYKDEKQPLFCSSCKLENMIDVIHKICVSHVI